MKVEEMVKVEKEEIEEKEEMGGEGVDGRRT